MRTVKIKRYPADRREWIPKYTTPAQAIDIIVDCKARGRSLQQTANRLNKAGFRTRIGGDWSVSSVQGHWYKESTKARAHDRAIEIEQMRRFQREERNAIK